LQHGSIALARLAETWRPFVAISQRSVYRDIAALHAQGVPIEGEAGVRAIACVAVSTYRR